jgi:catabolite regulation protein CreA
MVVALILSDAQKAVRYKDLGRTVLQCLHGVHYMESTLRIFQSAASYGSLQASASSTPSQILAIFDPHVRDCACHVRAQMLSELTRLYGAPEKQDLLSFAIACLGEVRKEAAILLREIEGNAGKPRTPELNSLKTCSDVWKHIGFLRFLDLTRACIPHEPRVSVMINAPAPAGKCVTATIGNLDLNSM